MADAYMHRHTVWQAREGAVEQVSCAVLDTQTWEELACATESVGPFESAPAILQVACITAVNLARGQYRGQQELALD